MSRTLWGIVFALLAGGCRSLGAWQTGTPFWASPTESLAGGQQLTRELAVRFGGVLRSADAEQRMVRVGRRLSSGTMGSAGAYHYALLDSERINAVSLPGGYIYLTSGLYEQLASDDLLAAALAHELAHLAAGDHDKDPPRSLDGALAKEISADSYAADLVEQAGFDRTALITLVLLVKDAQPAGWAKARVRVVANASMHDHSPMAASVYNRN